MIANNDFLVFETVVWNPWSDQAREIGDLGDDEYPNMLCVEAGHVSTPVILLPGKMKYFFLFYCLFFFSENEFLF